MNTRLLRWKIALIALAIAAVITAVYVIGYPVHYRSPEVSGLAVDKDTGKPIPGLTVTVSWSAIRYVDLHQLEGNHVITNIHSVRTVTDTNGAFVIPAWGPVRYWSSWRYFSTEPVVSFSKSGQNLGFWQNLASRSSFEDYRALPFQTVDFGKPSWGGQKLELPQWKLDKPLW